LENESLKTSEDEWDRPWIPLEDDGFSSACSSIAMTYLPTPWIQGLGSNPEEIISSRKKVGASINWSPQKKTSINGRIL
jgi:hypothetical protein